jgi:hypothetical protein
VWEGNFWNTQGWRLLGAISPFQPLKGNWNAVTFLNCNCISPESPGRRLIEDIECSFCLERAYGAYSARMAADQAETCLDR